MTNILTAFVCMCVGFWLGRLRQRLIENRGEAAVRRALTSRFDSSHYHLMNNITIPVEDGTTQVDHILVSRYGVFVIESKHYSGWIFANLGKQWTQVLYKKKTKFQNPVRQNYKHVLAVAKILDFLSPEHIQSVVVFTGNAVFKTPRPCGVFNLTELDNQIASFETELLSENRMQFCVGRLECCRMALTKRTDLEHVAHLERKFGDAGR